MADGTLPWTAKGDALMLTVRLTPRGGRDALDGIADFGGRAVLRVRVASPPVDGAANAALVRLLAGLLAVPRSAVRLAAGESARIKTLSIDGAPEALARRLADLTGVLPGQGSRAS